MKNDATNLVSPAWDNKISMKNSEWLAENVNSLDQSVKEILSLIEDGDFSLEKVDSDHPKQPELISRIKEISRKHNLLADHYNKLTGEFSSYIQAANETKNYEKTNFETPDKKLGIQNVEGQEIGSDLFLSSGGGNSDSTPNEGSESSSLSSDSDLESYYTCQNPRSRSIASGKMLKRGILDMETEFSEMEGVAALTEQQRADDTKGEEYQMMLKRISEYVKELKVSNQKLQFAEEEIGKLKRELQNNEAVIVKMGSLEGQLASAKNQIKLQEAEIEKENEISLTLQRQIVDLEAKLESEKRQYQDLQGSVTNHKADISDRDLQIQKLNAEFQDASGNFALEKWQLESSVSKLSERLIFHEARTKELEMQCESLANEINTCEAEKVEMERMQEEMRINWEDDMEHVKAELCKKNELVDTLNENLDGLKLKHDMLLTEKDVITAKLQTLHADLSASDDQIQHLEQNLHSLHSENTRLIAGSESANKLTVELKSRIDALEKEVEMQAEMISDMCEQKREAIRQLCFSLDYFRGAYEDLRSAYVVRKRPTAMVL